MRNLFPQKSEICLTDMVLPQAWTLNISELYLALQNIRFHFFQQRTIHSIIPKCSFQSVLCLLLHVVFCSKAVVLFNDW